MENYIAPTLKVFIILWDRYENKYDIMLKMIWKYKTTNTIIYMNGYIITYDIMKYIIAGNMLGLRM